MCGIAGFVSKDGASRLLPTADELDQMTDLLEHRGPDSRGCWYDSERGVGFGHRRLAIRDLSATGHQPMVSSCGQFVIVYNGEVYSHAEIVSKLSGTRRSLKGHSDTEVILEACAEWGVEKVLPELIGMFAFALYDKESGDLVLARDRLGIKPLYWSSIGGVVSFASELKSLRALSGWRPQLNRNALSAFMRHNYVPAPHSIYKNVFKLEPGTLLRANRFGKIEQQRYWDLRAIAVQSQTSLRDDEPEAAVDHLNDLLKDAVQRRLVSDVPIGSLLSGGIDSSLVTALMAEESEKKINTFSIGFAEEGFDEAPFAKAIADHVGTDHTELYAEADHALEMVEKLPAWYDEPFADSSQLPTALVCALTRQHVKVVLSGDGGDELFAGYSRYPLALKMWGSSENNISALRLALAKGVSAVPEKLLDAVGERLPGKYRKSALGSKVRGVLSAVEENDPDVLYRRMLSHWHEPDTLVIDGFEPKGILWERELKKIMPDFLDRMMLMDTMTYLPDDILTKVDRASMSVALEARVPLLDHRVVEYAWSLPRDMKMRDGVSKWILREVLFRRMPRELIERPKMGFGVPLAEWLRGPLRAWADELLDPKRLEEQGVFVVSTIRERWEAHVAGTNWAYPIWNVLMFQAWLKANPEVEL